MPATKLNTKLSAKANPINKSNVANKLVNYFLRDNIASLSNFWTRFCYLSQTIYRQAIFAV